MKYISSLLIWLLFSGVAFAGQEDLVTDGDFSETTAGSDLFVQEAYDTPLSLTWSINAGTPTINGQVIDFADEISSVIATSAWTTGKTYKVSVTVSSYTGTGNIILPYNGSTTYDQKTVATDGTYDYIIMVSTGSSPLIYSEAGHTATITVNYIEEVTTPGKGSFSGLTAGSSILDSGSPADNTFYEIVEQTGVDFTTIGAPNNTAGTSFYSTGTGVTLDSDDRLIELNTAWQPYDANLIEIVDDGTGWADCLEISYVDNSTGAYIIMKATSDLISNPNVGGQYLITFDYKTVGTFNIKYHTGSSLIGNENIISNASSPTWVNNVNHYVNITSATGDAILMNDMSAGEKCYLRNLTITPVTLDNWTADTGWGQTATSGAQVNSAYTIAATGDLEQDISAENGKIYHLTYTIADYAGTDTITPQIGGVDGTAKSANGTYTEDIAATGTGNLKLAPGGTDLVANILDVSVYSEVIIYVDGSYSGTETGSKTEPFNTIQEGINAAAGGDTVLVMAGTYTGAGNVNLDYGGAPNGFTVTCDTPLGCIIDGEDGAVRGAYFHNSETNDSEFSWFKITRCGFVSNGAGMMVASSPLIKNCWFDGNGSIAGSSLGGGLTIWGSGADPEIENCLFTANKCGSSGGALYVHSSITGFISRNCTFSANIAAVNYPGPYVGKSGSTIVNLISYDNVTAGMANENYMVCTPTYSIYDYSETVGDTPGAGCIDSASTDPKFKDTSVFNYTPIEPLVYNGGSNIYSDTMYDIKGSEVVDSSGDIVKYMPMGCFNFGISNEGWGTKPWGAQPWGAQPWGASLSGGQGVVVSYALLLDGAANFLNIDSSGHYLILN